MTISIMFYCSSSGNEKVSGLSLFARYSKLMQEVDVETLFSHSHVLRSGLDLKYNSIFDLSKGLKLNPKKNLTRFSPNIHSPEITKDLVENPTYSFAVPFVDAVISYTGFKSYNDVFTYAKYLYELSKVNPKLIVYEYMDDVNTVNYRSTYPFIQPYRMVTLMPSFTKLIKRKLPFYYGYTDEHAIPLDEVIEKEYTVGFIEPRRIKVTKLLEKHGFTRDFRFQPIRIGKTTSYLSYLSKLKSLAVFFYYLDKTSSEFGLGNSELFEAVEAGTFVVTDKSIAEAYFPRFDPKRLIGYLSSKDSYVSLLKEQRKSLVGFDPKIYRDVVLSNILAMRLIDG